MNKLLLYISGSIVALLILIGWIVPPIACHYVNSHGKELCGRNIYIDDIDLNLFTGGIGIDSLTLFEADEQHTFVGVGELRVNLSMLRLITGLIDIEEITVERLHVNVEQTDTLFNFSDMLAFFDSGEKSEAESSDPLPVVIEDILLSHSYVQYQDHKVGSNLKLDDVTIHIPGVDLRTLQTEVGVSFNFVDGGRFSTQVSYDDPTGDFAVDLHLKRLNLHLVLPYLQQSMAASNMKGLLDADMKVKGNLNHILAMQAEGQSCVSQFQMTDKVGELFFAADTLSLATSEVSLLRNRYGFSHIYLGSPDVHVSIAPDSIDNITRMLTTAAIDMQPDTLVAEAPQLTDSVERIGEEPFDLYITHLEVSHGAVSFTDSTLRYEPFHYQVKEISFEADSFRLADINHIAIGCQPGSGNGTISIQYHGSFDDIHNMSVNLRVADVELKDFSPYTIQMFGNPLVGGTLSFDSDTKVKQGDLDSYNHLRIVKPDVEKKLSGIKPEMNVPFKAGIYILTDKNGICDMELPVKGNIDEPKFSVKRLIFKTLGKLIVKVATSPMSGTTGGASSSADAPAPAPAPVSTDSIHTPAPAVAPADSVEIKNYD